MTKFMKDALGLAREQNWIRSFISILKTVLF